MIEDLTELVKMYDDGVWSRGDFWRQITLLVPEIDIQTIVGQLPDALRDDFVHWLRETYDNDIPAERFVSIGRQSDPDVQRSRLEALRGWLRSNPSSNKT